MNREKAIRKYFFDLISNSLVQPGNANIIPVYDEKADSNVNIYVLLETQRANDDRDFIKKRWNATIEINIIHKQDDSYTKDIVDDICEQIEALIPYETTINNEWQITNNRLDSVDYGNLKISETQTICMKILTYSFKTTKI
jgi:hypothetical protein